MSNGVPSEWRLPPNAPRHLGLHIMHHLSVVSGLGVVLAWLGLCDKMAAGG